VIFKCNVQTCRALKVRQVSDNLKPKMAVHFLHNYQFDLFDSELINDRPVAFLIILQRNDFINPHSNSINFFLITVSLTIR